MIWVWFTGVALGGIVFGAGAGGKEFSWRFWDWGFGIWREVLNAKRARSPRLIGGKWFARRAGFARQGKRV